MTTQAAYEALSQRLIETTAERDRARDVGAVLEQQVSAVARYATLTLDSISVERRGMAEDILALLNPHAPDDHACARAARAELAEQRGRLGVGS